MKKCSLMPLVLLGLLALPTAWACSIKLAGIEAPVRAPPALSSSIQNKLSSRYEGTQCIEFHVAKRKPAAGFLCSSTSADFLADFGISSDSENAVSQDHSFKVNTPMSSYDMAPIKVGTHRLYIADVDCDEASGPIYRATSTCNVAVMPLENGRFLYSNFVLETHVVSSHVVNKNDILTLWKSLKLSNQRTAEKDAKGINQR